MAAVIGGTTDGPGRGRRARGAAPGPHGQPVVRSHRIHGAVVLTPEGILDDSVLRALDDAVDIRRGLPVILDLSACALIDTAVLEQLDGDRWARTEVRIVCPRRSARQLLARAGVRSVLSIFRSIEQAIA